MPETMVKTCGRYIASRRATWCHALMNYITRNSQFEVLCHLPFFWTHGAGLRNARCNVIRKPKKQAIPTFDSSNKNVMIQNVNGVTILLNSETINYQIVRKQKKTSLTSTTCRIKNRNHAKEKTQVEADTCSYLSFRSPLQRAGFGVL